MKHHPNPQGKGLVPVLDSLIQSRTLVPAIAKPVEQIGSELFTSMFVLHSRFQFKPVVGKSYWLYRRKKQFQLSLISPWEWGENGFGVSVGECVLQDDITWSLKLDDSAANNAELTALIENKRQKFEQALTAAENIETVLPFYLSSLPFYQRVFASALANSLRGSMLKSGLQGLNYNQAKSLPLENSTES